MRDTIQPARGKVRLYRVSKPAPPYGLIFPVQSEVGGIWFPDCWRQLTDWTHNTILYEWGSIVGNLLLGKGLPYRIGGMYIEFENTASPDDPVAVPSFDRGPNSGIDYYNDLGLSSDRDYLRVPLIAGILNSTDATNFPKGNAPTFFAQTQGITGVHGKPFSDANNSKVFGGALVAFLDQADATQDLVLARFYKDPSEQQAKLPTSQVGVEWEVDLE